LTWAISPDSRSFIRVGRESPSIVAASVVVKKLLGRHDDRARGALGI
jgi:hypothetical protein